MNFIQTPLPGVIVIKPDVIRDNRGFFLEAWHKQKFASGSIPNNFVQDNHSQSSKNTLRGLHYQIQHPQGKLIRVLRGSIFDVVIDLRRGSDTFGKWYGHVLSADNMNALWCPPEFAHGFLVTSEKADVYYKCSDFYAPEHERTLIWNDEKIGIQWPLSDNMEPCISEKDRNGKTLMVADVYP